MVQTLLVSADHERDCHPLADQMTKLLNFTKIDIREFSAFSCSLQLLFDQILSSVMVCLTISQKITCKS